jgi:trehalose utilization protein
MTRRSLCFTLAAGAAAFLAAAHPGTAADKKPIRVVVWDERQPAQKQAYENFLGNQVADYLTSRGAGKDGKPEITVRSVGIDDPQQGLAPEILDNCDVLIWWGHQRHNEIKPETAQAIVDRVKSGQLNLIALHSAHWSRPFITAMNEKTTEEALKTLSAAERKNVEIKYIQPQMRLTREGDPPTPSWTKSQKADGGVTLEIKLPSCVFRSVRADAKPGHLTTLAKNHPIAKGVPDAWDVPQTEMYGGPFEVPKPDVLVFTERWDSGETFESGCVWNLGKGKVFYFRPGHETYPIFKQELPLRVVENAVRWMGKR